MGMKLSLDSGSGMVGESFVNCEALPSGVGYRCVSDASRNASADYLYDLSFRKVSAEGKPTINAVIGGRQNVATKTWQQIDWYEAKCNPAL